MKKDKLGTFHTAARARLKKCKGNTQVLAAGVEMLGIIADLLSDIDDSLEALRRQ